MRNDAGLHARSPRGGTGRGSFFPSSLRAISSYLRSVSANASTLASTVRSAGASVASTVSLAEDERQREQVQWAGFDKLELGPSDSRHVLLLTYLNGFQVWDVEEASNVRELVSRRDGPVAFLRLQPYVQEAGDGSLKGARPLLLVVTGDTSNSVTPVPGGFPGGYGGGVGPPPGGGNPPIFPTVVRFYSLRTHTYVHVLRFRSTICAVRCSPRVVAVALHAQVYCFDPVTLQNIFSVLTYPTPQPAVGSIYNGYGAMAVGPRWLAYAANQPLMATTGRVSPQHLTPSPGVSPSTSPANGNLVAHYAKESSKHIAAGIVTLGDMGYKTLSRYCSELLPDAAISPVSNSQNWKALVNGHSAWQGGQAPEPEHAGIVIVRDFVSKTIVTQFRAHSSPLSALAFDPSGTLLVSASVHGHNLNVFRLTPSPGIGNSTSFDASTTYVHLYKLYRGMTPAVIQDISFSKDSQWITISSSRGTSHIFAISPFGGTVGPHTHVTHPVDGLGGSTSTPMPSFPWWSSTGPVRVAPQAIAPPPPAITLSVVSRIKNGIGGWRGTVTGAAAAAAGRSNAFSGAVAAIFHDGGGQVVESELAVGSFKDQLWVLAASGHLLRYLLRPSAGVDVGYNNGNVSVKMANSNGPGQPQELRLVIEALEKWDVCRRPNWVDREERVDRLSALGPGCGEGHSPLTGIQSVVGKEGVTTEEMQRWYMSNAEVQMYHPRPLPVWAKPKVYFHVMTAVRTGEADDMEIESLPTKVVEVRKKDLVPVMERLQNFTKIQGQRDMSSNGLPAVTALQMQLLQGEQLHDQGVRSTAGGPQIQRTSSRSSFGSEGCQNGGANGGLDGFHQADQDSPEISATGTPTSLDFSPSYFHNTVPALETMELLGPPLNVEANRAYFQESFSLPPHSGDDTGVVIGSPPMVIPRPGRRDVGVLAVYHSDNEDDMENGLSSQAFLEILEYRDSAAAEKDSHFEVEEDGGAGKSGPQEWNGRHTTVFDATYADSETLQVAVKQDCWESVKAKGKVSPIVHRQSLGYVDQEEVSGETFGKSNSRLHVNEVKEVIACLEAPGDSAVVEDTGSTSAHSKSEDNEGGDAGDDVWGGGIFPFFDEDNVSQQ